MQAGGKTSIKSSISNFQEIEYNGDEHLEVHIQDFQSDERNQVKLMFYDRVLFVRAVARGVQGLQLQPSIFEIKVQLHPLIFRSQDLVLRT